MPAAQTATHSALYIKTSRKLARLAEKVSGRGTDADLAIYAEAAPLQPIMAALNKAFDPNATVRSVEEDMETTFSPELAAAVEIEIEAAKQNQINLRAQYAARQAAEAQYAADRAEWMKSLR
jgi:chaperonin GroEL (HSP60 family)